ncbi:hypothetical protein U1Q18_046094 [Sarracenia purpurea var. burkii]
MLLTLYPNFFSCARVATFSYCHGPTINSVRPVRATLLSSSRRPGGHFSGGETESGTSHRVPSSTPLPLQRPDSESEEADSFGGGFAMEWWHKMMVPMRRIWIVLAKRARIRKTGKDSRIDSAVLFSIRLRGYSFVSLSFRFQDT